MKRPGPDVLPPGDFLELAALVQSGIDGANLPLARLLAETAGREFDAVRQIEIKLAEAELWLGALVVSHALEEPA